MKKVLLIEDDLVMRENTAEILELANFDVTTAENGKTGSMAAKKVRPDIIICDIMMPEIDGYGVLHILSKDPDTSNIPFIFLTAKAEKSDIRRGMELGADDYLTKPFDDMELLKAIESRLKKSEVIQNEFSQSIGSFDKFLSKVESHFDVNDFSDRMVTVNIKKKQNLYIQGDSPSYLYYVNKGKVKVYRTHDDGKEYVIDIFKPGDYLGIPALVEDRSYSDSAVVLEDSEIYKIPKEDFHRLLYKNREISALFIKLLSNYIEERERQLLSFAYDTVRKRAAEVLVQLNKKYKSESGENTRIRITRDDIAGMAGTATETIIRCLSEFKGDKLIEIQGREIIIVDPQGLEDIRY